MIQLTGGTRDFCCGLAYPSFLYNTRFGFVCWKDQSKAKWRAVLLWTYSFFSASLVDAATSMQQPLICVLVCLCAIVAVIKWPTSTDSTFSSFGVGPISRCLQCCKCIFKLFFFKYFYNWTFVTYFFLPIMVAWCWNTDASLDWRRCCQPLDYGNRNYIHVLMKIPFQSISTNLAITPAGWLAASLTISSARWLTQSLFHPPHFDLHQVLVASCLCGNCCVQYSTLYRHLSSQYLTSPSNLNLNWTTTRTSNGIDQCWVWIFLLSVSLSCLLSAGGEGRSFCLLFVGVFLHL